MSFSEHFKSRQVLCKSTACKVVTGLVVLILVVAVVFMQRDRLALTAGSISEPVEGLDRTYPSQIYYGPPNSIAVLPFQQEGEGAALATESFLLYGFAEALIDQLVQNPDLQVTSASSSSLFPAGAVEMPIVAERLKVTHLLYGSIYESGDRIRIMVRLLNAKADKELWSESFDTRRPVLPALRDRITLAVISAMNRTPYRETVEEIVNTEVWFLLLEARQLLHLRGAQNLQRAETLFRRALETEPGSGTAWLGLAETWLDPLWPGTDSRPGHEKAREATLMALKYAPDLSEAHVILSRISRTFDWDWQGAHAAAQQALKLRPGSADVLVNASDNEFTLGNFETAIKLLEQAISRDPIVLAHLLRLGLLYEFAGDYDQSLIAYRQLLGLYPGYPAAHAFRARIKLAQHKPESALKEAEQERDPFWQRYARILALLALERFDEADLLLEQMIVENARDAAFQIAEIHAFRGDVDGAFDWLERAWENRDGGMSEIVGNQLLADLEDDQRWADLLTRMGLP
jgi:TolB-like protein/Tfp pilus assembly protein PilF